MLKAEPDPPTTTVDRLLPEIVIVAVVPAYPISKAISPEASKVSFKPISLSNNGHLYCRLCTRNRKTLSKT